MTLKELQGQLNVPTQLLRFKLEVFGLVFLKVKYRPPDKMIPVLTK